MSMEFAVLASGSSGNVSMLRLSGRGLLLDLGLGPRLLERRLADLGSGWHDVDAVLLTHTHGDHWREPSLAVLCERRIAFHCHEAHGRELAQCSRAFADLQAAGLVRCFRCHEDVELGFGVRYRALPLPHDGGVTCGFRIEGHGATLGYASDLGTWRAPLVRQLADVDILAVEFNHDVDMERHSNRPRRMIARVLGDAGHLSNEQAAQLVTAILSQSQAGRLQHLVQVHLSRDCNRPKLARAAVEDILIEHGVALHTARQDRAGPWLRVAKTRKVREPVPAFRQGWLW
jgi:phosphoribosyl 1,2-cyclic phosphodiesterase